MEIFDCKELYEKLIHRCEKELAQIRQHGGSMLRLGVLTLTSNEQNMAFSSKIQVLGGKLGVKVEEERVAVRNIGRKFMPALREWASDESMQAVLVLYEPEDNMPSLSEVYGILQWEKDAYGLHFHNIGRFCLEEHPKVEYPQPAEVAAVVEIIEYYKIPIREKKVVILGDGKPFERMLMQKLCIMGTEVAYKRATDDQPGIKAAVTHSPKPSETLVNPKNEVVISCANKTAYLSRPKLTRGSIIIDNGYNFNRGRIGGDVDFNSVQNWVRAITPVPGGVKSIAQAVAMLNFTRILKLRFGLADENKEKKEITRRFNKSDKKLEANRSRI